MSYAGEIFITKVFLFKIYTDLINPFTLAHLKSSERFDIPSIINLNLCYYRKEKKQQKKNKKKL